MNKQGTLPAQAELSPEFRPSRRVLLAVPPGGFGAQLGAMRAWLDANCGPEGWAWAPAGTGGVANDALAFYFVMLTRLSDDFAAPIAHCARPGYPR